MHKIMGWIGILITYAVMVIMMVLGLEIIHDLRDPQLKVPITVMIIVTWIGGGFMAYMIHEYMKEPL